MEEAIRALLETMPLATPPFEAYKPLIVDGLVYFIMRLPEERLQAVAAEQLGLGEASSNERIVALLRHCPTLHKLGQVVSHERALPIDFRRRLQFLETLPPAGDLGPVLERIRAEIGEIEGLEIGSAALAQGSVAIVVPFTLHKPHVKPKAGVFKVLLPGVEQRLAEDLAIWPELAGYLEERSNAYGLPPLDYRGFLDGVGRLLRDEIRLDREQRQLVKAASFYSGTSGVVVPKLFAFSTPVVTAMERIDGTKITEADLSPSERRRLAELVVTALLAKPFWRGGKRSIFHADPHAGNLFVTPDGRLAIFDWALTTVLDSQQLSAVVQSLVCATTLDEMGLYKAIARLGSVVNEPEARAGVAAALAEVRMGRVPGFTWLVTLLDDLARQGSLNFAEEAVLFRKAVLTLTGVVADIWDGASIDSVIVSTGALQFIREAPLRSLLPIGSRRLGSHLSTWDLMLYGASLPWAPVRFIFEGVRDGMKRYDAVASIPARVTSVATKSPAAPGPAPGVAAAQEPVVAPEPILTAAPIVTTEPAPSPDGRDEAPIVHDSRRFGDASEDAPPSPLDIETRPEHLPATAHVFESEPAG